MSNVKHVYLQGRCPCHVTEQPLLAQKLATMNSPAFGLRICYSGRPQGMIPNRHGGQTAVYGYIIQGTEAVSVGWLQEWVDTLRSIGGESAWADVVDAENGERIHLRSITLQPTPAKHCA